MKIIFSVMIWGICFGAIAFLEWDYKAHVDFMHSLGAEPVSRWLLTICEMVILSLGVGHQICYRDLT